MELELMYCIAAAVLRGRQDPARLPEMVRALYDSDVLAEDTIMLWFQRGTNTKGR